LLLQIAYCWVLASYHHHGKDHPETTAALAAAEKADPQAWVPKLMAGLAYPSLSLAPASVRGGFMEAMVRRDVCAWVATHPVACLWEGKGREGKGREGKGTLAYLSVTHMTLVAGTYSI
jgi:hypothetical protein